MPAKTTKNEGILEKPAGEAAPKKSHKALVIGLVAGVVVLLAALVVVLFFVFRKDSDINTTKIMAKLSENNGAITSIINYSEANDPNGVMGQANQYTSKSSWEDTRIPEHTSEFAGTIEVFRNTKDAELREWKIEQIAEACEQRITLEKYGSAVKQGWTCREYQMFRIKTVVVRLSQSFDDDMVSGYKARLENIVDEFAIEEKDVPSADKIGEIRTEIEGSLTTTLDEQEKKLQEGLDDMLKTYDERLDAIAVSLDFEELEAAKGELDFFKEASYFSSKIADLERKINTIEKKIADNKKQADEKAAKAAREALAKKNRKLGAGKYTACTNIEPGTYDVYAIKGNGNFIVHSDEYSHHVNEVLSTTGTYGWNKEYKNMILSCGDIVEIMGGLTVQIKATQ